MNIQRLWLTLLFLFSLLSSHQHRQPREWRWKKNAEKCECEWMNGSVEIHESFSSRTAQLKIAFLSMRHIFPPETHTNSATRVGGVGGAHWQKITLPFISWQSDIGRCQQCDARTLAHNHEILQKSPSIDSKSSTDTQQRALTSSTTDPMMTLWKLYYKFIASNYSAI